MKDWLEQAQTELQAVPEGAPGLNRADFLADLAEFEMGAGDKPAAEAAAEALEKVNSRDQDSIELLAVARAWAAAGNADKIEAIATEHNADVYWEQAIRVRTKAGQFDQANADLAKMRDPFYKPAAYATLADALLKAGRVDEAKTAAGSAGDFLPACFSQAADKDYDKAIATVQTEELTLRLMSMSDVADIQLDRKDMAGANKTIDTAEADVRKAGDADAIASLHWLMPSLWKLGREKDAVTIIQAFMARRQPESRPSADQLTPVIFALATAGDPAGALGMMDRVKNAVEPTTHPDDIDPTTRAAFERRQYSTRDGILIIIACRFAYDGNRAKALDTLKQFDSTADTDDVQTDAALAMSFAMAGDVSACQDILRRTKTAEKRAVVCLSAAKGLESGKTHGPVTGLYEVPGQI